jgi:hypothetical protein
MLEKKSPSGGFFLYCNTLHINVTFLQSLRLLIKEPISRGIYMKWKMVFLIFFSSLILFGCSSGESSEQSSDSAGKSESSYKEAESAAESAEQGGDSEVGSGGEEAKGTDQSTAVERMVIYNAELDLKVKDFMKAQTALEAKAAQYGGFIVESSNYRNEGRRLSGTLVIRIPQKNFNQFLNDAEGTASKVDNRHVSGQDVTEEYVDLESRLRSKRVVEERLISFMEKAEKTEDLLKISQDLAGIQEEIEQLAGRINYLKNQTDFSTVTVSLYEERAPSIDKTDLNTWDRTKEQFTASLSFLLSAFSGLFVFFAGNLPVLMLIGIAGVIVFLAYRKYRSKKDT